MKQRFTFPKATRLRHRKEIAVLMEKGKAVNAFPLRGIFTTVQPVKGVPVMLAIAVPKRNFKKAVERNLLKRRIREAFRLNKQLLSEEQEYKSTIHLLVVYTGKEAADFALIQNKIILILQRLKGKNEQDPLLVNDRPADTL